MAQLLRNFLDGYQDIIDNKSDPRVNDWLLMSSPFPTLAICLSYIYFANVLGPRIMYSRKQINLQRVIMVYNFLQVIANAYLFYQSLALGWLFDYSFRCQPVDYSYSPKALMMARFCWWYFLNKFTDLFDTLFFVLRKKNDQITTLHVVHHAIMPMGVWFGVKFAAGGHSTFFGMINTFVHTIMYSYYLLAALGPRFQKYLWWKKYLTVLQMVQFVLVFIHAFQLLFIECNYPKLFAWLLCLFAVMFYFLFADFYKQAYKKKQQAIRTSTTQRECDPPQEHNAKSHMNRLYEQHNTPPGSYTTDPRQRAAVKNVAFN